MNDKKFMALYLFSTSNHNRTRPRPRHGDLALYLFSTSNHTLIAVHKSLCKWLYTSFLHQTTTALLESRMWQDGFIPLFYIKPQRRRRRCSPRRHGFIPLFYIKPQQFAFGGLTVAMALYLFSTSNHNLLFEV